MSYASKTYYDENGNRQVTDDSMSPAGSQSRRTSISVTQGNSDGYSDDDDSFYETSNNPFGYDDYDYDDDILDYGDEPEVQTQQVIQQQPEEQTTETEEQDPGVIDKILNSDVLPSGETMLGVAGNLALCIVPGGLSAKLGYDYLFGTEEEKKQIIEDIKAHPWQYAIQTGLDVASLIPGIGFAANGIKAARASRVAYNTAKAGQKLSKLEGALKVAKTAEEQKVIKAAIKNQKKIVNAGKRKTDALKKVSKSSNAAHGKDILSKTTKQRGIARANATNKAERLRSIKAARDLKNGMGFLERKARQIGRNISDKVTKPVRTQKEWGKVKETLNADKSTRASLKHERKVGRQNFRDAKKTEKKYTERQKQLVAKNKQLEDALKLTSREKNLAKAQVRKEGNTAAQLRAKDKAYQLNKQRLQNIRRLQGTYYTGNLIYDSLKSGYNAGYGIEEEKRGGQKSSRKVDMRLRNEFNSPLMALTKASKKK